MARICDVKASQLRRQASLAPTSGGGKGGGGFRGDDGDRGDQSSLLMVRCQVRMPTASCARCNTERRKMCHRTCVRAVVPSKVVWLRVGRVARGGSTLNPAHPQVCQRECIVGVAKEPSWNAPGAFCCMVLVHPIFARRFSNICRANGPCGSVVLATRETVEDRRRPCVVRQGGG